MDNLKERFEKRLEACNEAISKYNKAMLEIGTDFPLVMSEARSKMINQLLFYLIDAKYYIRELEAEIRANERYIKTLKEDRDEAWRFCKL